MKKNPQVENGYTRIANEILESLSKLIMSGEEWRLLIALLRFTYGWNKTSDTISLSQFCAATGMKKQNVCRTLKKLLSKQIIRIIKSDNKFASKYSFNKHFDEWVPLSKQIKPLSEQITGVIKTDKNRYPNGLHPKKYKDTLTKDSEPLPSFEGRDRSYLPEGDPTMTVERACEILEEMRQKNIREIQEDMNHDS